MGGVITEMHEGKLLNCDKLMSVKCQDYIIDSLPHQIAEEHLINGRSSKKNFTLFHQNIRGFAISKIDDLNAYLNTSPTHVLCISEHHLDKNDIEVLRLPNYNLNAKFCRSTFKKGGVCIFTHETLQCLDLNLNKFCREKDLEICAVELHL
jgi:hypothetical protein